MLNADFRPPSIRIGRHLIGPIIRPAMLGSFHLEVSSWSSLGAKGDPGNRAKK